MNKKWVFGSLVTDDKDAVGLIAYALYKHKKHTLAIALRKEGKDEAFIQQQVQTFHDQTLQNNSLEDYREKSKNFLDQIFKELENNIQTDFDRERALLAKQHKKELTSQQRHLYQKIKNFQHANQSWPAKLGTWLLSGIPGIVSSLLVTSLIIGASVLFTSEDTRQEVLRNLWSEYLGIQQNSAPSDQSSP